MGLGLLIVIFSHFLFFRVTDITLHALRKV